VSLQKQGANKGATTAFLISTPESGIDSIAITYALLDPIMTVARPIAAFFTAAVAGISENLIASKRENTSAIADLRCPIDNCCDGVGCDPREHRNHHTFTEKMRAGLKFAIGELWEDMVGWFFIGLILAGAITSLIPSDFLSRYLGGGLISMIAMLVVGIPMYICATASTPIAAALILKGASPGAALVFLLAGPATNMASLTVIAGMIGKRATAIYLGAIAVCSVVFGLLLDEIYLFSGLSAKAMAGKGTEIIPYPLELAATVFLLILSIKPLYLKIRTIIKKEKPLQDLTAPITKTETKILPKVPY
jgi:uncharacterized membrane protein YraQ (UPF0718 family)